MLICSPFRKLYLFNNWEDTLSRYALPDGLSRGIQCNRLSVETKCKVRPKGDKATAVSRTAHGDVRPPKRLVIEVLLEGERPREPRFLLS